MSATELARLWEIRTKLLDEGCEGISDEEIMEAVLLLREVRSRPITRVERLCNFFYNLYDSVTDRLSRIRR